MFSQVKASRLLNKKFRRQSANLANLFSCILSLLKLHGWMDGWMDYYTCFILISPFFILASCIHPLNDLVSSSEQLVSITVDRRVTLIMSNPIFLVRPYSVNQSCFHYYQCEVGGLFDVLDKCSF